MNDHPERDPFSVLSVFAEFGSGDGDTYLWDANGVPIEVGEITGRTEALDAQFRSWARQYDSQSSDREPFTGDPEGRQKFDQEGTRLAEALFELLHRKTPVIYRPLDVFFYPETELVD